MGKILVLAIVAAGIGGGLFFQKYRMQWTCKPRQQADTSSSLADELTAQQIPISRQGSTIRIASFDLQAFNEAKQDKPEVMRSLAEVMRRFDVIAVQEIRTSRDDLLPRLVEQINASGRHYDYVIGPRLGPMPNQEQFAFVFDAGSVEVDRSAVYTIEDPGKLLTHDPLVAPFRVRGPAVSEAFTFDLINVHVDPDSSRTELAALADVYRAVRTAWPDEDDFILLGNLGADDRHLGPLGQLPNMSWALRQTPTNTRGTRMSDNILFNRQATIESTGRAGVFDLIHELHLTMGQALEVSDHMPVWMEFSIFEGGQPGRMAATPNVDRN